MDDDNKGRDEITRKLIYLKIKKENVNLLFF